MALKADLTEIDRRIQQSLKPIEESSEGKEVEEDNDVCRERHDMAEELRGKTTRRPFKVY